MLVQQKLNQQFDNFDYAKAANEHWSADKINEAVMAEAKAKFMQDNKAVFDALKPTPAKTQDNTSKITAAKVKAQQDALKAKNSQILKYVGGTLGVLFLIMIIKIILKKVKK